ncbi:MAG: hypothetical protein LBU03_05770 [Tannerellaceae bacterium]|jgi:hypothetical protein|nr:hypothetical protein [Tannerellaceae bacterium]
MKMLYTNKLLLFIAFLPIVSFSSCDNEEDPERKVIVHYIRFTDPTNIVPISRAPRGSTIAFVGEGLEKICGVTFNDIEATLNPVFVTPTTFIVSIPNEIPNVITHSIYLRTSDGLFFVYSPFFVELPVPYIRAISDLQAADSVEVTLYGAHFYADVQGNPPVVIFSPELDAEVLSVERDSLIVRVPMGTQQGAVTVTTEYGSATSSFIFRPDRIPAEPPESDGNETPVDNSDPVTETDEVFL